MKTFNPEKLVAIGEGLAAGFGPFTLHRWSQRYSFPSLIARQLGVAFSLPLFEPPGIGNAPGFEPQPVILPGLAQATVFNSLPPVEYANLSVPGMTLRDALERKPCQPWVMQNDALQTACNLILGARRMATNVPTLAQVDCAASLNPTGVIVALGFAEALEAAIASGDRVGPPSLDSDKDFGDRYAEMVKRLSAATMLLFTVPDPFDTPFFMSPPHAARVLRVDERWLCSRYGILEGDFLKVPAVHEVGYQIFGRSLGTLPPHSKVSAANSAAISARVKEWNAAIRKIATSVGAQVYDLHDFTNRLATDGLDVGTRHLTADYLGGLYQLNGYYLGHTGHALIANEVLALLRQPPVDIEEIATFDPAAQIKPAEGRLWGADDLSRFTVNPTGPRAAAKPASVPFPDAQAPDASSSDSPKTILKPLTPNSYDPLPQRLVLPEGLTQELTLDPAGSYFGDGIAANNCESVADAQFDGAGQTIFGGLALVDSHLTGSLRFEFTPIGPDRASFKLYFDRLAGDDAVLATPLLFRMPFQHTGVSAYPAPFNVSTGEVDLITGNVSRLRLYASFGAVALGALVAANKHFPTTPLSFLTLDAAKSPLEYSSASARFEQSQDGKLDFTFYGTRFVPLGPGTMWPLNFGGPDGDLTLIPASGTVMHPHLRLTTKPVNQPAVAPEPTAIPSNCVREFTFHTHNTAFGDGFDLRIPELGGPSTGRSHLMGRAVIQFGVSSGGTVPVAVRNLPPGGIFSQAYPSPIADAFPVRLGPGPRGYDQELRYPRASYTMEKISLSDDPFDIAMGAVNVETGQLFNDHLHRAFIEQDVINALLRVEPRVRQSSFFFRGPALFASMKTNALMFRFLGEELLPYPAGLAFPQPDFTSSYYATLGATLKPYVWMRAIECTVGQDFVASGEFEETAANSDKFYCKYEIPADPSKHEVSFYYRNDTQIGEFTMHSLAWVGFGNSAEGPVSDAGWDIVTFSGFGVWEKNNVPSLEQVAVQIWNNPANPLSPYIGIQVSSGDVSNVDKRPENPTDALP